MNFTTKEMSEAEHVFYNPDTNMLQSFKWSTGLEMYEVWTYAEQGCLSHGFAGMRNILLQREKEPQWEFIGVI